jgi:hypothetical protein
MKIDRRMSMNRWLQDVAAWGLITAFLLLALAPLLVSRAS